MSKGGGQLFPPDKGNPSARAGIAVIVHVQIRRHLHETTRYLALCTIDEET